MNLVFGLCVGWVCELVISGGILVSGSNIEKLVWLFFEYDLE